MQRDAFDTNAKGPDTQAIQPDADPTFAERWRALSRYDDDIRVAVERLRPFGDAWVNELGRAYLALNEDKAYIPSIVSRLIEEATQAAAQRWATAWRRTANGEVCTEESLNILREAEADGYTLSIEENGTFVAAKASFGTSYLRSNYDIERFGEFRSR